MLTHFLILLSTLSPDQPSLGQVMYGDVNLELEDIRMAFIASAEHMNKPPEAIKLKASCVAKRESVKDLPTLLLTFDDCKLCLQRPWRVSTWMVTEENDCECE